MKLPFSVEQFLKVFELYNQAVWPAQIILYVLAIVAIYAAAGRLTRSAAIISWILGILWIWMGIVYHIIYFSVINKAAYFFGAAFVLEGSLFLYAGLIKKKLSFRLRSNLNGVVGGTLIFFALVVYPVWGYFQGHVYPASPTFGLPCPTTIFTLGILLFTSKRMPVMLLLIPFVWSLIGFAAAFSLGIREDIGLVTAGVLSVTLLLVSNKKIAENPESN